jgi:hypothetical protein
MYLLPPDIDAILISLKVDEHALWKRNPSVPASLSSN